MADCPSEQDYSSDEEEDNSDVDYRFVASPGWIKNFLYRYELENYKMQREKGSVNYDAFKPWITEWLKTLYADCVLYKKNLPQLLTVIVNFDECAIKYKSIPQIWYLINKEGIQAKKKHYSKDYWALWSNSQWA